MEVTELAKLAHVVELTVAQTRSTHCLCGRLCRWKQTDGGERQRSDGADWADGADRTHGAGRADGGTHAPLSLLWSMSVEAD